MPTVYFLGQIVPSSHVKLNISDLPVLNFHSAQEGFDADIEVSSHDSAISVKCVATKYDEAVLVQLHKIGYDLARAIVNLYTFSSGISLSVVFDEIILPDGKRTAFIVQDLSLAALCTSYTTSIPSAGSWGLGDAAQVVFTDPLVFGALDDLVGAISHHRATAINCARAVEALRNVIALPGSTRIEAWNQFRNKLNIDRGYLQLITETSTDGRHGGGTFIPGTKTGEIVRRTWIIMNRFFEFRKNGNQPLSEPNFPLLS